MKKILFILVVGVATLAASAQGLKDVKINEILVKNVDSYADDHAHKVGWIELFNSGYSQVNLAGAYLRLISGNDTTTYRIPKGDVRTIMPSQGYIIFFCDQSSNKGTFHTNFRLDEQDSTRLASLVGLDDKLELIDQSGKTIMDEISYDVNTQLPDVSFGRYIDDNNEPQVGVLHSITPLQSNNTKERIPKSELFRKEDPLGFAMSITAMSVVFSALLLLYLIFKNLGKYMVAGVKKKKEKAEAAAASPAKAKAAQSDDELDGETVAAIALALQRYDDDMHDIENTVLTINKVAKAYSPWSSKIYTLTQLPNKK